MTILYSDIHCRIAPEFVYVDEEIAPERKECGYVIDLAKERDTIASKDAEGYPIYIHLYFIL
jgi:hypothetical protein